MGGFLGKKKKKGMMMMTTASTSLGVVIFMPMVAVMLARMRVGGEVVMIMSLKERYIAENILNKKKPPRWRLINVGTDMTVAIVPG